MCVCVCVCWLFCTYCTGIGSRDVCYTKHSRIRVDNISPREIITILAGELLSEIHVIDISVTRCLKAIDKRDPWAIG